MEFVLAGVAELEQREAKGEGEQHHDKLIAEFPKRFWVTSLTQIFFLLLLADEL
jgi:hypothetical protein